MAKLKPEFSFKIPKMAKMGRVEGDVVVVVDNQVKIFSVKKKSSRDDRDLQHAIDYSGTSGRKVWQGILKANHYECFVMRS